MPVWRLPKRQWSDFYTAINAGLARRGYGAIDDFNAEFGDRYGPLPMGDRPTQRVSASMAYLTQAVRRRPNLTIVTDTRVERRLVGDGRVARLGRPTGCALRRGATGCPDQDMLMILFNKAAWYAVGRRTGGMLVKVNKSFSEGSVELGNADPAGSPDIRFSLLSDERDLNRLTQALALILSLAIGPEVAPYDNEIFFPDRRSAMQLHRRTWVNKLKSLAIMLALEIAPVRAFGLPNMAVDAAALLADPAALRDFVRRRGGPGCGRRSAMPGSRGWRAGAWWMRRHFRRSPAPILIFRCPWPGKKPPLSSRRTGGNPEGAPPPVRPLNWPLPARPFGRGRGMLPLATSALQPWPCFI